MREMKDCGIALIGMIPIDWKTAKIKNLFSIVSGATPSVEPEFWDGNITWITPADYKTGDKYIVSGKRNLTDAGYNSCSTSIVPTGSIIFSKRAPIGTVAIAATPLCTSQGCLSGIPIMPISSEYYYYVLSICTEYFELLGAGTTFKEISANSFANCVVPFPPKQEQDTIAYFLNEKCAQIEAITTDIQAQIDILEQYKRSVITETVTKGLNPNTDMKDSEIQWIGMMPSHWECIRGKYILKYVKKPVREGDGIITCFRDGEVTLRSNRREDGFTMADKEIGYQGIDVDDLVVHGMDGFAGAIGISDSRGKASPVLNVLDTKQNKRYIMYFLRSMAYRDVFLAMATGIRVRSCDLRWNKLAELYYPVPPLNEQEAIVAHIDSILQKANDVIVEKKEQLSTLEAYKKSLIYEYVTGKKIILENETSVETVMIDPHVIMAGMIIDQLGQELKGKIQIQKLLYLFDNYLKMNLNTQYYRYNHGPYDRNLDSYLNILVKNGWFRQVSDSAIKYEKGKNHADFCSRYKDAFVEYRSEMDRLVSFVKGMRRTSQIERIATAFAVWNDLILDGISNPTDDEIIHEIRTNWTPNKANIFENTWKDTLGKMKRQGIIPHGQGLHTLPMSQRGRYNE